MISFIVVEPLTNKSSLTVRSFVIYTLLLKLASLVTVNVSLSDVAPTIVVAPCTYKVLFKLASFVTNKLLLKLASLVTYRVSLSEAAPTKVVSF